MALPRRRFILSALVAGTSVIMPKPAFTASVPKRKQQRVIVIGGGFAGATAAKYLKMWSPKTEVVMIERNAHFVSCPQSNLILSGNRSLQQLTHDYEQLHVIHRINTVRAEVIAIDAEKKTVHLHDGVVIDYDRLIIAPGIDFIYDDLPELASPQAQQKIPHAWKAGPQTINLQQQLHAMPQGGNMVITIPPTPFRCPPGPYERACQVALYLKQHNPKAKLLVLDANSDIVSKKALFTSSWQRYYPNLIEYIPNSRVEHVTVKLRQVETEFDYYSADVLNVIPPQKAGKIAELAGVVNVDKRWCAVDFLSYESTVCPDIHVIGDAVHAKLPKSAHMANAQAKVCAAAIASLLAGQAPEQEPVFSNTCYSFIDQKQAGHVVSVYRYNKADSSMLAMPGGGVSEVASELEGAYASAWATNIWADTLN